MRWIETLVAVASPLLPFIELRRFKPGEFDAVLAFASGIEGGQTPEPASGPFPNAAPRNRRR